jgi:AcrR family transcriptional regulator
MSSHTNNGTHEAVSQARQRLLGTAQELFHQRGYKAVTMQDIAAELGVRQASIYYHVPEGKEQLFVEVAERSFQQLGQGLQQALAEAGPEIEAQLEAAARWFSAQPPMSLLGMMHADMPALSPDNQRRLERVAYACLFEPMASAFRAASERGQIRAMQPDLLAGSFLALMDGVAYSSQHQPGTPPRQVMAEAMVSLLIDGLRQPGSEKG